MSPKLCKKETQIWISEVFPTPLIREALTGKGLCSIREAYKPL